MSRAPKNSADALGVLIVAAGLAACDARAPESVAQTPSPARVEAPSKSEHADPVVQSDCSELQAEVERLRHELAREQERRLEREREWFQFQQTLSSLELRSVPDDVHFEAQIPDEERPKAPEPPPPVDEAKLARATEIARSLRTLLTIEGVRGIDLLEVGALHEGFVGPVVFRLLDERGRLAGSLCAERLRLEGSRTARTLTLVLEDGYEMREGVRTPFGSSVPTAAESDAPLSNVRRIEIVETDPMDWVDALPELFGDAVLEPPHDDGKWNLLQVRGTLNQLLRRDAANGYWRLKALGGVDGNDLRDVHVEELDADGKVQRRLFADRLRVELQERGVMLLFEDGAQVRGDEKVPFLDGRFRVYLPRVDREEWRTAELPGFAPTAIEGTPKSD